MNKGIVLLALAALLLLGAGPARAEWRRAESPNFVVFSTTSEAKLRERILQLEDYDRLLRRFTTVKAEPAANKLHVYMVRGAGEMRVVRPFSMDVAGFYHATRDGIAAFVDTKLQSNSNEFLFHEYAHHFMFQYSRSAFPTWYVEGSAEYFMTAKFESRHVELGGQSKFRTSAILPSEWLPMERVMFGDRPVKLAQAERFYTQSWLLVHYFFSTPERLAALRRYLNAVARGADRKLALEAETGLDAAGLTDELKAYVRGKRISVMRIPRDAAVAPPPVNVTTMPRSADDLLLYEAALRIGIHEDLQAPHLERIRKAATRHGADSYARRVHAKAEAMYGDAAAADRLLDALLAEAPDDAELLYLKGLRHFTAAENGADWDTEARAARPWFARAHKADANHYQALFRYASTFRSEASFVSENSANILLLAYELAPQVAQIGSAAAWVLIERGEYAHAEMILTPLIANTHNPEMAEWASNQLNRARTKARAAEPSLESAFVTDD